MILSVWNCSKTSAFGYATVTGTNCYGSGTGTGWNYNSSGQQDLCTSFSSTKTGYADYNVSGSGCTTRPIEQ